MVATMESTRARRRDWLAASASSTPTSNSATVNPATATSSSSPIRAASRSRLGQFAPAQQPGNRDRGDRDVVLVTDQVVEPQPSALSGDHDRGVEDQPVQSRSSAVNEAPRTANSP